MSFPTPDQFYLDPVEYPLDSQKRQEKERELQEAYEAEKQNKVPEIEWNKGDNGE